MAKNVSAMFHDIVNLVQRGIIMAAQDSGYTFKGFDVLQISDNGDGTYNIRVKDGSRPRDFLNVSGDNTQVN